MKEYRIRQAAVLLRQTQATIAEIANQVGYEIRANCYCFSGYYDDLTG